MITQDEFWWILWDKRIIVHKIQGIWGYDKISISHKLKRLRFDNGGEFSSRTFNQFCIENDILR